MYNLSICRSPSNIYKHFIKKKLELVVLTLKSYTFLDLINANLNPDQPHKEKSSNNIYTGSSME